MTRFGNWIEKHWPEQMTSQEVKELLNQKFEASAELFKRHDDRLAKLEQDLSVMKTQITVKSRIVGDAPNNMTPFASRLKPTPVPTAGGNQ